MTEHINIQGAVGPGATAGSGSVQADNIAGGNINFNQSCSDTSNIRDIRRIIEIINSLVNGNEFDLKSFLQAKHQNPAYDEVFDSALLIYAIEQLLKTKGDFEKLNLLLQSQAREYLSIERRIYDLEHKYSGTVLFLIGLVGMFLIITGVM